MKKQNKIIKIGNKNKIVDSNISTEKIIISKETKHHNIFWKFVVPLFIAIVAGIIVALII